MIEIWIPRRMLKIPWTARGTHEQALEIASNTRSLIQHIRERHLSVLGHLLRRKIEHLLGKGKKA